MWVVDYNGVSAMLLQTLLLWWFCPIVIWLSEKERCGDQR